MQSKGTKIAAKARRAANKLSVEEREALMKEGMRIINEAKKEKPKTQSSKMAPKRGGRPKTT